RYQVAPKSAFSPQKPRSKPPSNSLVRSGFNVFAGFVNVVNSPPRPLCVGVKPAPCAMPPTRFVPLKVAEVRYGCGSCPASPNDPRSLPKLMNGGLKTLVNVHAALAFGNQLRRLSF